MTVRHFAKLLMIAGLVLLVGALLLDPIFSLIGTKARLIEEGGNLNYAFHLDRDRMVALSIGVASLILGGILYTGARIIARNEAAQERSGS